MISLQKFIFQVFLYLVCIQDGFAGEIIFLRQNSEPKYFEDPQTRKGLCDEIYMGLKSRLAKKALRVKIDHDRLPIKRILSRLELGTGHVFCGSGRNKKREEKFIFSKKAVYSVSNKVAAHKSENFDPRNLQELARSEKVVGVLFGTSSATFLKSVDGVAVYNKIYEIDQGLRLLNQNKVIRFFYYHDLGLNYYVKKKFPDLRVMSHKFRTVPQWLAISRSLKKADVMSINEALDDLYKSGEIDRIWAKFF